VSELRRGIQTLIISVTVDAPKPSLLVAHVVEATRSGDSDGISLGIHPTLDDLKPSTLSSCRTMSANRSFNASDIFIL
jgi:hypothetical protein